MMNLWRAINANVALNLLLPAGTVAIADTGEPNFVRFIIPDGSVIESAAIGGSAMFSGGDVSLDLDSIHCVGIDDLSAVETHCINRVYNTVSHFIRFTGGGEVRFAVSLAGDLLELSGDGVRVDIREGNALYFGPYHSPSNPA